jgi:hypothetical protein
MADSFPMHLLKPYAFGLAVKYIRYPHSMGLRQRIGRRPDCLAEQLRLRDTRLAGPLQGLEDEI